METVVLSGKRELDIFINPQRQRLLRELTLAGEPMTPKQLSGRLGISASAVQHHIQKLCSLGVVAQSHTERIRGITAHYYQALPVTVRVGYGVEQGYENQRLTLLQNGVNNVLQGFDRYLQGEAATRAQSGTPNPDADMQAETHAENSATGDVLWGVSRLTQEEARTVMALIRDFLQAHETPAPDRQAWEYALIAYPVGKEPHA